MTTAAAIAGERIGWSLFRRELNSAESRLLAVSVAVIAAVVVAISMSMWTSTWGAVGIIAVAAIQILVFRVSHRTAGLTAFGIVSLIGACVVVDDARFLLIGLIPLLGAGLLGRVPLLAAARDPAWRATGLIAAAIASLAAADRIERAVFESSFDTPLEGLSLSAGIVAGALLFLVLGMSVWSVPRIAAKRMRAGLSLPSASADAMWLGTLLTALAIGFDLRSVAETGTFSDALGRSSWIAIASALGFAATRLGTPAVIRSEIQPLWIVVLGGRDLNRSALRHVASLAARWENGPVTIVAAPELAPRMRGAHLRLAQSLGDVHALFPQRSLHLADWLDTLPPRNRWQTVPVRELYCDDSLWSELFETQLETTAEVVVVIGNEGASALDRLPMLPTGRTTLQTPVPDDRVITSRLDTRNTQETTLDAWISATASSRAKSAAVRFALVAHTKRDEDFAQQLVNALQGAKDEQGRVVRADSVVLGGAGRLALAVRRATINDWIRGVGLQRIRRSSRGRWFGGPVAFLTSLLSFGMEAEYDLLLIEGEDVLTDEDVWRVVERNAIEAAHRVISVADDSVPPSKDPDSSITGVIRYRVAGGVQTHIEEIKRRYLALDFDPEQLAGVIPPASRVRRPVPLTKLIDTLALLFVDIETSRMVVIRAGMQDELIAFDARSIYNWTNIVNEAIRQNALSNLVAVAAEMYPNVPELADNLQGYTEWAAQQDVPKPRIFERGRSVIVAWLGMAVGCFVLMGVLVRESTRHLFGLPRGSFVDAFTSLDESVAASLRFLGRTFMVAVTYLTLNPLGAILVMTLAGIVFYLAGRNRSLLPRIFVPSVVAPLVLILAFAKTLWYDVPVMGFSGVLTRLGIEASTFDPPAIFASRSEKIWSEVVCSRIATLPEARSLCGGERVSEHLMSLYGTYLLEILFTIAICSLGIIALRKLLLPDRNQAWNLPRTSKWTLGLVAAVGLLGALLPVPWTYARTVASMTYPYICTGNRCEFRIRIDANNTFAFHPDDGEITRAPNVAVGPQVVPTDILQVVFRNQVTSPSVAPADGARPPARP